MAGGWDQLDDLGEEVDRAVARFTSRLVNETVTHAGGNGGIEVEIGLDGTIREVRISEHALGGYDAAAAARRIQEVLTEAQQKAKVRREELTEGVQILGLPVMRTIREMSEDPVAWARSLPSNLI